MQKYRVKLLSGRILGPITLENVNELISKKHLTGQEKCQRQDNTLRYLPIDTATMLKAAEFWSQARQMGRPTASDKALDGDMILAAQAFLMQNGNNQVIVATTNLRHLSLFVNAREWKLIK